MRRRLVRGLTVMGAVLMAVLALSAGTACARGPDQMPGFQPPGMQPQMGPQFGFGPMPGPATPALAHKITEITVLHQFLAMGLTAADIQAVLPPLRGLRDAQKALETRTTQILDDYKRALLAAQPGQNPPADPAQQMQAASQPYAEQAGKTTGALVRVLGPQRAQLFLMLAIGPPQGQPQFPGQNSGMPPGAQPGNPFGTPGQGPQPGVGGPTGPGGQAGAPFQPQWGPGGPGQPMQPGGQGQPMQPGGMMQPPFGGPQANMPMAGPFGMPGMPGMQPRLTLAELVDLLEQKLAAMKK